MNTKTDFINENTKKGLLSMALPMMAAMFLNMAYNLVDSLWIGNLLGETAYAALTNATPVILLLSSVAMGATNGVSILLSRAVGAKETKKIKAVTATSLLLAVAFSLSVTVILEVFLRPALTLMHTPAPVFELAYEYLAVYLLGYLPVYLYCYFTAVLRSFGNSMFQVVAMLVCTLLNAALDPLFIRRLGFRGAAVATVLSQTLCLVFMLVYIRKKKLFRIELSCFDSEQVVPLIRKAIPSVFQQSIPALSTTFLTSLVGGYGICALAAYGIVGKLETVLFYPAMALNMVLTTVVGQCAGGKRYDRARDYVRLALLYGAGVLSLLSLLIVCFSGGLSRLFVDSGAAAAIVKTYFRIVGAGYVLNTVTNCLLGSINGMGKPSKSMMCMVLYYLIVRMPLSWLLSVFGPGLNGIWAAVLISHMVAAMAAVWTERHLMSRNSSLL